eukprot:scaffold4111_cov43-Cyclotella_meneghiniana.AAC.1
MDIPPSDATQWTKMRQEIVESLRAELQNGLQSRVDQLEDTVAQLKRAGGAEKSELKQIDLQSRVGQLESEKSELKQRCDTLHHTNSMILQRLFEGEDKISKLQEQVKSLQTSFEKAQRKTRYREVVLKNLNWEYPLDFPTVPELLADGFDEDECTWIVEGITKMAEVTRKMRMGEYMYSVDPDPGENFSSRYNGYKPHYKEFADALVDYQRTIDYREDQSFCFALDIPLSREIMDLLHDALQQTHFHEFDFYSNNLEREGYIEFVANCVKANTRLKQIRLESVKIEHSNDFDLLCKALNSNGYLQKVIFTDCDIVEDSFREIFKKLKSKTIERIEVEQFNGLPNLGPTDMSEFLSSNLSLSELSLCDNAFNEQDIVYMSNSLRHNTTLRKLCITHTNPPNNWDLLESIIFDCSSLNTAFYSNHHTRLRYSWSLDRCNSNIEKFNMCNDPILNRRKKVYTILSRRNRSRKNAALFDSDGISIKQIPQILPLLKPFSEHHLHDEDAIQGDDEVVPLSIAYEIMRDWKMPELYNLDHMDED